MQKIEHYEFNLKQYKWRKLKALLKSTVRYSIIKSCKPNHQNIYPYMLHPTVFLVIITIKLYQFTAPQYSHVFSSTWQKQNIRSVIDLLHWNPHCRNSINLSTYGINLDRTMLHKIMYAAEEVICLDNYSNLFDKPTFLQIL